MDKYLVNKISSVKKNQNRLKEKTLRIQKKRDTLSKKLLSLNAKIRFDSMPDDQRAALQKEVLMISALLDKTSRFAGSRYRDRCSITNWGRGLKCGLRRNVLREYGSFGQIAGLIKF